MSAPVTQTEHPEQSGFVWVNKLLVIRASDLNQYLWLNYVKTFTNANLGVGRFPDDRVVVFPNRSLWALEIFGNVATLKPIGGPCLELVREVGDILEYLVLTIRILTQGNVTLANAMQFRVGLYLPPEVTGQPPLFTKGANLANQTFMGTPLDKPAQELFYTFRLGPQWEMVPPAPATPFTVPVFGAPKESMVGKPASVPQFDPVPMRWNFTS